MNDLRGEVEITIGGKRLIMRPTFNAIKNIENRLKMPIQQIYLHALNYALHRSEVAIILEEGLKATNKTNIHILPWYKVGTKYSWEIMQFLYEAVGGDESKTGTPTAKMEPPQKGEKPNKVMPQITNYDLIQMQRLNDSGNRSGMYEYYYNRTGVEQAKNQAEISSLTGFKGQVAVEANRRIKELDDLYDIGDYPKEGVTAFSEEISDQFLNDVKSNISQGGDGILSENDMISSARSVWREKGLEDHFPGNIYDPLKKTPGRDIALESAYDVTFGNNSGEGPTITPDNDDTYTPTYDTPDPNADNPTQYPTSGFVDDNLQGGNLDSSTSGGFLSSIGSGFSSFASARI